MDNSPPFQPPQTGITAEPPAASFPRPAADVARKPAGDWDQLGIVVSMVVIHGFMVVLLLGYLLVVVQRFKKIFDDFGMKLPWMTELAIDLSDFVREFFFLLPVLLLPLMIADGAALYFLRRRRSTQLLSWALFILIMLLLFGASMALLVGTIEPLIDLGDGLAR